MLVQESLDHREATGAPRSVRIAISFERDRRLLIVWSLGLLLLKLSSLLFLVDVHGLDDVLLELL